MVNDFYTKYKTEIEEIAKNTRKQLLEENIPFWENRILDVEYGGYFNTFNKKGERVDDVKVGWFVGRDMYTFSALYRKIQPQNGLILQNRDMIFWRHRSMREKADLISCFQEKARF